MENENQKTSGNTGWINKSIDINASDDNVWRVLTEPAYIVKWASAFEEGVYVESDWTEGSPVVWKKANGDIMVKGKVEVNYAPKILKISFHDNTKAEEFVENYSLSEHEGITTLSAESGPMAVDKVESMEQAWNNALKAIKQFAETL